MSTSSTPCTGEPVARGNVTATSATLLIGAAALAGLLLGGSFGGGDPPAPRPAPAPLTITQDGLRLQVPGGWVRSDAVAVLGFSRPLGLRSKDDRMRATVELLPATSATLLPAAFLQTLRSEPERPEVIRLSSGQPAWRYRVADDDGSVTILVAAPTTGGVATVACLSPVDGDAPRGCEAVARSITVPGSRPLELSTSAAFHSHLPAAVSKLDDARTEGLRELSAATRSTGQATAADELFRAHKAAGDALMPLATEGDGVATATIAALDTTATAYAALADAARSRSPQRYADAARAASSANVALRRTITKVAAATSAASRTAIGAPTAPARKPTASAPARRPAASAPLRKPAASLTPAAAKRPANSETKSAAKEAPAASTSHGVDLTLPLLALLVLVAIVLAIRQTLRAPSRP